MENKRLRILSYAIMMYMLFAFAWWALLLFNMNREAYRVKRELLYSTMRAEGRIEGREELHQTADYKKIYKRYKRQEWMIFGEASVFVFTLLAGLWFIHRSYARQVQAGQLQRNFLLAITHELKSPIASIQLVLETLMKRKLPKDKADHLANTALQENERLLQLVENLLLTAKLDTSFQPHFEETNPDELFLELIAKAKRRHPQAIISYKKKGNVPLVKLDRSGMALLFNNLLDNAVKYSDNRPVIHIEISADRHHLFLTFTDQGPGIPAGERKKVFEKFYRIGSEETRKTKGTGLGLFIVYQIVKAHKGRIKIRDNRPRGARIGIELPLNTP